MPQQRQHCFSSQGGNGGDGPSGAQSGGGGGGGGGNSAADGLAGDVGDAVAEYQRKLAALQGAQAPQQVASWLSAAGSSASAPQARPAGAGQSSSGSGASGSTDQGWPSGSGSSSSPEGDGHLVSPQYGYAVLGGIDPQAAQEVAGAQQPRLHPTRSFNVGETYEPTDLSPLCQEEEEAWVPVQRQGHRTQPLPARLVAAQLDYKDPDMLLRFVTPAGRIRPRRQTRLPPSLHRRVSRTIKFARHMALLPYEMRVGHDSGSERWKRARSMQAAAAAQQQQQQQ